MVCQAQLLCKTSYKICTNLWINLNKIKLEFDDIECFVFKEFKKYISTEFKINSINNQSNKYFDN